jgi:hypothetical protein
MDKVKVSDRALEARIKRALEKDGQILKKCRADSRWYSDLGDYYIVNQSNVIAAQHCSLEKLGKELKVLKPYEEAEI